MDGIIALNKAKKYVNDTLQGAGAIAGKNVQVSKIEPVKGGNRVTFTYTLDDGTPKNSYLEVMSGEKGASVVSANIDESSILSFTLSNGEKITAGKITIDTGNVNLENYYTKEQTDKKFVQIMELDNLIAKKIEEVFEIATQQEIKNIFVTGEKQNGKI